MGVCPSVAFMPARTVSISTPDGTTGEYADTRDLSAGWGDGGDGNERPMESLGFGFALETCAPAADFPAPALDLAGFAAGGGTGAGYVNGSRGTSSALTRCI
jgi:hypothetical protein